MHTIHVIDEFLNARNAWMLEFLYELEAQGVACTVCTQKRGSQEDYPFEPVLHRSTNPIAYWARSLQWRNPALVHAHGAKMAELGAQLAKRLELPLVVSVDVLDGPLHADLVLPIYTKDLDKLPNAAAQVWRPGFVRTGHHESDCDITYVGENHIDTFLQAISILEDPSLQVRLLHRSKRAEQLAIDLGIPGQVTFGPGHGRVTVGDPEEVPISLIQAAGQDSAPCMIGPCPSRTPFSHKQNALVTSSASAPELAQVLEYARKSPQQTDTIVANARKLAEVFDMTVSARHLIELYAFSTE